MSLSFKINSIEVVPLLTPNEVHIWSVCLSENESNIPYFVSLLSQDELEKAGHFRFPRDQKRYTISRGILRCLLAEYLREEPQKIGILYGLWGKPCLQKEKDLSFNLSHSGDYALYAFTQEYEVGIDVECINGALKLEDLSRSIFSIEELSYWKDLNAEEKLKSFFNHWVSKEAFLKATGKGWLENRPTPTFLETTLRVNNDLSQKQNSRLLDDDEITYPYCFEFIPGYASALFVAGPSLRPLHFIWNPCLSKSRSRERMIQIIENRPIWSSLPGD